MPSPHRAYKTKWQARTRRWPLPRLVCSSESMSTAPSSPPPVSRFFLAPPRRRTRGHEIDRFSILFGRYFSRVSSLLTFSVSRSCSGRIVGTLGNYPSALRLLSYTETEPKGFLLGPPGWYSISRQQLRALTRQHPSAEGRRQACSQRSRRRLTPISTIRRAIMNSWNQKQRF